MSFLKQLEDPDVKSLQLKRSISISTMASIEPQREHTVNGLLPTWRAKPKKQRSEYQHEIFLLDHESGSDS